MATSALTRCCRGAARARVRARVRARGKASRESRALPRDGRRRLRLPPLPCSLPEETKQEEVEVEEEEKFNEVESLASNLAKLVANPSTYLGAAVLVAGLTSQIKPNAITVVAISALPVVGLTAISKTKAGENVARKVEEEKKKLLPVASERERQRVKRRKESEELRGYFGSTRSKLSDAGHLTGVLPGDAGFDLLGLSAFREEEGEGRVEEEEEEEEEEGGELDLKWRKGAYAGTRLGTFFEAELLHARWAMLAALGCLIPEALARYFGFESIAEPIWWKVGYSVLHDGVDINYAGLQGFRIAGDKGVLAIAACQLVLMGGPEYARRVGIESLEPVGIFLPGDVNYPGGQLFDPLGLSDDPDEFLEQQVKEIKNGRLAMLSMLGYAVQAFVTGEGPLENLDKFLSDPMHENILKYL